MNNIIKLDETNYIIGIDIGLGFIKVSYLDQITLKPVVYDISGGFNETAIPFCMQYIKTEKEWLIGHDAKANINQENTYIIDNLFELLLDNKMTFIDEDTFTPSRLLNIFLDKVVISFKHINPKAKIISLAISVADFYFEQLKEVLKEATDSLDINKVYVNTSTIGLLYYLDIAGVLKSNKNFVLLRYETAFFSHFMIDIKKSNAEIYNYAFDESLALNKIEKALESELIKIYKEQMKSNYIADFDMLNINKLLEQSLVLLFQKYEKKQQVKLYYNFAFPPFQSKLTYNQLETILSPFIEAFNQYIKKLNIENSIILFDGPGFKMLWPQKAINEIYSNTVNIIDGIAKGNCLAAAGDYIKLNKWLAKADDKYYIAYINGGIEEIMPIDIKKSGFLQTTYEQVFIIDFEEDDKARLSLVSTGEKGTKTIIDEVDLKRNDEKNPYLRVNLKIDINNNTGSYMSVEYLPL